MNDQANNFGYQIDRSNLHGAIDFVAEHAYWSLSWWCNSLAVLEKNIIFRPKLFNCCFYEQKDQICMPFKDKEVSEQFCEFAP